MRRRTVARFTALSSHARSNCSPMTFTRQTYRNPLAKPDSRRTWELRGCKTLAGLLIMGHRAFVNPAQPTLKGIEKPSPSQGTVQDSVRDFGRRIFALMESSEPPSVFSKKGFYGSMM